MLEASQVMSLRHQHTLAAYCDALADMVTADRELKKYGATFVDDKGRLTNHPAWYRKKDSRLHMLRIAEQFGLTASALSRVSAVEHKPANDEANAILFG
jgi:P27 family predicted phage terminase small subunit